MSRARKLQKPFRYVLLVEEERMLEFRRQTRKAETTPPEVIRMMIDMYVFNMRDDGDLTLLTNNIEHQVSYLIKNNKFNLSKLNSPIVNKVIDALNSERLSTYTKHNEKRLEVTYGEYVNVVVEDDGSRVIRSTAHNITIQHHGKKTIITLPDEYSNTDNMLCRKAIIHTMLITLEGLISSINKLQEKQDEVSK